MRAWVVVLVVAAACSSASGGGTGGSGGTGAAGGAGGSGGIGGEGGSGGTGGSSDFVELIGRDFSVPSGSVATACVRIAVPADMHISAIRTTTTEGLREALLTIDDEATAGETCGSAANPQMLHASGPGTADLVLPDGAALMAGAGRHLQLALDLYNPGAGPLSGHTSMSVRTIPAAADVHPAEAVMAGTAHIALPPHSAGTAGGGCTLAGSSTIVALWPHMNRFGTHVAVEATIAGAPSPILDRPFDPAMQPIAPLVPPLALSAGDAIHVTCAYQNTTDTTITGGTGIDGEVCRTTVYRYPATGALMLDCVQFQP